MQNPTINLMVREEEEEAFSVIVPMIKVPFFG